MRASRSWAKYSGRLHLYGFMSLLVFLALSVVTCSTVSGSGALPRVDTPLGVPSYAVKVAGETTGAGVSWSIWLFGKGHGKGCWATESLHNHQVTSESITCGFAVPRTPFQFAASGNVGTVRNPRRLVFFLLRRSITRVGLLLSKPGSDRRHWVFVRARRVSDRRARTARLPSAVGVVALVRRGSSFCPSRLKAYARDGHVIAQGPIAPCEG